MKTEKIIEIFKPYLNGYAFLAKREHIPDVLYLNAKVENGKIVISRDFFTIGFLIDDKWSAKKDGNDIILTSCYGENICLIPQNLDVKSLPTVEWDEKKVILNLVNEELWEKDLIREIAGNTYYPLDLFRFKDTVTVLSSSVMKRLISVLGLKYKKLLLKTLYYYIDRKDSRLYVGVWDYKRYMPLDPIGCCRMDT